MARVNELSDATQHGIIGVTYRRGVKKAIQYSEQGVMDKDYIAIEEEKGNIGRALKH